jgi:hypothetical protein
VSNGFITDLWLPKDQMSVRARFLVVMDGSQAKLAFQTAKHTLQIGQHRVAEVATLLATAIARVQAGRSGQKERLFGCASNL